MYPLRKELVGKRFLFVRSSDKGARPSSRSTRASNSLDLQWKSGVIRACSEKDCNAKELQVLVEYEGEDWTTRDWLPVYAGGFRIFLVENTLVWAQRADPSNSRKSILWPALTFLALVDLHNLENEPCPIPIEFLGDHKRSFVKPTDMRPYQDDDGLQPSLRNNLKVVEDLASWQRLQKSQAILMDGPFTLTGFRVQVYRQNLRQWFSAVITSHDLLTRELRVMDDTVLQTHRVEPALVQVVLLVNDAELDSLLRGETVRVLPVRQHRQSQVIITSTCTLASTTSTPTSVSSWQLFQELARGVTEHPGQNLVAVNQQRHNAACSQKATSSVSSYSKTVETAKEVSKKEQRKSDSSRGRSSSKRRKSSEGSNSKEATSLFTTATLTSSSTSLLTASQASQFRNYLNSSHTSPFQRQDVTDAEGKLSSPTMSAMQLQNQQQSQILTQSSPFSNHESAFHSVHSGSPKKQSFHPVTSSSVIGVASPCRPLSSNSSLSPHSSPQERYSVGSPIHNSGLTNKASMSSPFKTSAAPSVINQTATNDGTFHSLHNVSPQLASVSAVPLNDHPSVSSHQYHQGVLPSTPLHDHLHLLQYQQQHFQQCQRSKQVQHPPSHLNIHQQYQQYQLYLSRVYNQVLQRYLVAYQQLQLLIKQHKSPDQQRTLNHYEAQVLYLYQEAQLVQKLSTHAQIQYEQNLAQFERHMQLLPYQIQQQIDALQEQQRQYPRLEPEKLQAFFHQIQQQRPSPEQISELYSQLVEQQQKTFASKNKSNSQNQTQYRHSAWQEDDLETLLQSQKYHQEEESKKVVGTSEQSQSKSQNKSQSNADLIQQKNKKTQNMPPPEITAKLKQEFKESPGTSKSFASRSASEEDLQSKLKCGGDSVKRHYSKNSDRFSNKAAAESEETITGNDDKALSFVGGEEHGKQKRKNTGIQPYKRNTSQNKCSERSTSKKPKLSEFSTKDDCKRPVADNENSNNSSSDNMVPDETRPGAMKISQSAGIAYPSLPGAFSGFLNLDYIGRLANLPSTSGSPSSVSPDILSFSHGSSSSDLFKSFSHVSKTSKLDSSSVNTEESPSENKDAVSSASTYTNKQTSLDSVELFPTKAISDAREMATESLRIIADKIVANQESKTRTNSIAKDFSASEIIAQNQERPSVIKISPTRKKPDKIATDSNKEEIVSDDVTKISTFDSSFKKSATKKPRSKKRKAKEVDSEYKKNQKIDSCVNEASMEVDAKKQEINSHEPKQISVLEQKEFGTCLDVQHLASVVFSSEQITSKSKSKKKLSKKEESSENMVSSTVTPAEVETTRVQSLPGYQSKSLQLSSDIKTKPLDTNHSVPHSEENFLFDSRIVSEIIDSMADSSSRSFGSSVLKYGSDKDIKNLSVEHKSFKPSNDNNDTARTEPAREKKKKKDRRSKKEKDTVKRERKQREKRVSVNGPDPDNARNSRPPMKGTNPEYIDPLKDTLPPNRTRIPSFEEKLDIIYNTPDEFQKNDTCGTTERTTPGPIELTAVKSVEKGKDKASLTVNDIGSLGMMHVQLKMLDTAPLHVRNPNQSSKIQTIKLNEMCDGSQGRDENQPQRLFEDWKATSEQPTLLKGDVKVLANSCGTETSDSLESTSRGTDKSLSNQLYVGQPPENKMDSKESSPAGQQLEVREEKSAMETVSRLVAAKRESSQKAKNKKRQQLEKRTRQGRKPKEGRKKKSESSSSATEQSEFTLKLDPLKSSSEILESLLHLKHVEEKDATETKLLADNQSLLHVKSVDHTETEVTTSSDNSIKHKLLVDPNFQPMEQLGRSDITSPGEQKTTAETAAQFSQRKDSVIRQVENVFDRGKVLDSIRHSSEQYRSTNFIENNTQSDKEVSSAPSKTLEMIKQDIKRKLSKKDKLSDLAKMPSEEEKPQDLTSNSSMPDFTIDFLKHCSEKELTQQENPGNNSVKEPVKQITLMNAAEESSDMGKQENQPLDTDEEQSEEKRFKELKRLLKAKKHVEAKQLCEAKSIKDETKHAVVKELIKEEKNKKNQTWSQLKDTTSETKPVHVEENITEDKTKVKTEHPVVDQLQVVLKEAGEADKKPGENGGEVVIKRKRGRPRKYKPEDGKMPQNNVKSEIGGAAVVKTRKRRTKKAAGSDDEGRPLQKKVKKERRKKKEMGENERQEPEDFFIQEGACHTLPKLPKCRECREIDEDHSSSGLECCRFNLFRRLKRKKNSQRVLVAGFLLPEHASLEDKRPWQTLDNIKNVLDKEKALYILEKIGDEFCTLVDQEKAALALAGADAPVTYKRAVRGVREMCDACATTIFNIHWVCHRCGFGVCLDCYRLRVKERSAQPAGSGVKRVFEFRWMACSPGFQHQPKFLNVAQIIPQNLLNELREDLHCIRRTWQINKGSCPCCREEKADIEEIAEETSNQEQEMKGNDEVSQPLDALQPSDNKQGADSIKEEIKTEEMPTSCIESIERTDGQDADTSNTDTQHSSLICSEKLDLPSPETSKCDEGNPAANLHTGNVSKSLQKVMGNALHPVVPLTDVCTTGDKLKWKEKVLKIQPIKLSTGLNLLMDYETSSGESTPLDSPFVGKIDSKSFSHTSFAFPPAAANEPLNDNLNLLAHLASLHGFSALKDSCSGAETETKVENENELSNSSSEKSEAVFTSTMKEAPKVEAPKQEKEVTTASSSSPVELTTVSSSSPVELTTVSSSSPVATVAEATKTESTEDAAARARSALEPKITEIHPAPHSWFCDGRLLRLHKPHHPGNLKAFQQNWTKGEPVLVSRVDQVMDLNLWTPQSFEEEFGTEISDVVNCKTGSTISEYSVGAFWRGFESMKDRPKDSSGQPIILKLKDWPPGADFCEKLPSRFENLMKNIPVPEYTTRIGERNLAARLPDFFVKPDLGPKMYNAYGSAAFPHEGTTNLHVDMSDAVNVMMYVGVPKDPGVAEREREHAIAAVDAACDEVQQQRVRVETDRIGAMWHIYTADDADKIRACLRQYAQEMRMKYPAHHDPIHDQCFYLDHDLRERLRKDYNVEGYAICQCLGDAVFIPAGAPHQVRNLYNCIKVAEDFVSPEHIHKCFEITQEFRHLSDKHTNHEDKLQIKNMIFHAVKDAIGALKRCEKEEENKNEGKEELEKLKDNQEQDRSNDECRDVE